MDAVLRVFDNDLRRDLAMKVIIGRDAEQAGGAVDVDPGMLARFLEEAQVTGQLEHAGIVPVHELGLDAEGRVYFTMQLVRGRNFKQILELVRSGQEDWSPTRALGVLLKVCEAMAYAHDKGVVHRDLKPANVMVGKYGAVYVMDWGLARVDGREDSRDLHLGQATLASLTEVRTDRKESRESESDLDSPILTLDGTVMGTPAYMPPEQARGAVERVGPRSDVYALGAMLYQLLAAQVPYVPNGARISPRTILMAVISGPPTRIRELAPESVPAELEAICEKAMARDPKDRYPDMGALAADLRAYLEGRVVEAYRTGAVAEFKKWVGRNKGLAASVLIATFLVVGVSLTATVVLAGKNRDLEVAREDADAAADAAESSAIEARRERDNVLRLSAFQKLEDLQADANALWPAVPDRIGDYRDWLERAQALIDGLEPSDVQDDPGHRAQLASLRARALPQSVEEQERDRESHPRLAELQELEDRLEQQAWSAQDDAAVQAVAELEAEVEALRPEVDELRTFTFTDQEDNWWHAQLEKLVAEIESFADEEEGLVAGRSPRFGLGVARRLALAEELRDDIAPDGELTARWERDLPAIRAAYPGLVLPVQVGLLPIGADPDSGLWEFSHQATGEEPLRDADGKLQMTDESGVVLVLLPGGSFWMGAQSSNRAGRNFDPLSGTNATPVHKVTLSPFLLSKYELTQEQWKRFVGSNPSTIVSGAASARTGNRLADGQGTSYLHPVETVSWDDCMRELPRMGLALPSEASGSTARERARTRPGGREPM